jgi:hypothetical protein
LSAVTAGASVADRVDQRDSAIMVCESSMRVCLTFATDPGTETIEFTPTTKPQETMQVVMKNVEAIAARS